jgi:hypothetical protein
MGFSFKSYWPLDTSRYTRQPRIGTFHGRPVIWIAPRQPGGFGAPLGDGERIGLDPRTHEPVAERVYFNGRLVAEALVLERKPDIAAGKYVFFVPNRSRGNDPASELTARGSNPYALRAGSALRQRPLWLGARFKGIPLGTVTIGSTFAPPTGIGATAARYVVYDYGNVTLNEFNARDLFGAGGGPLRGRVILLGGNSAAIEGLELVRDGLLVQVGVRGSSVLDRAGALRLARALRPLPPP